MWSLHSRLSIPLKIILSTDPILPKSRKLETILCRSSSSTSWLLSPTRVLLLCDVSGDSSKSFSYYLNSMAEALSGDTDSSVLPEIIWNFSHCDSGNPVTLAKNPHFYLDLPTRPTNYDPEFQGDPTERFDGAIYVLTNDSHRVFLEFDENLWSFDPVSNVNKSYKTNLWAFDHISNVNRTLIFRRWCPVQAVLLS